MEDIGIPVLNGNAVMTKKQLQELDPFPFIPRESTLQPREEVMLKRRGEAKEQV